MKIFISGGCKNGKSHYAQQLALAQRQKTRAGLLYYIATMKAADSEDEARIARHRRDREGFRFITIEQPVDIDTILDKCDPGHSFLLDSLTALLANEMFPPEGAPSGYVNEKAADKIISALRRVTDNINDIVIVSDYIYSDALLYDPLTEEYRKSLALIDRAAAGCCDVVLEAAFSNLIIHRGKEIFGGLYEKIH